VLGYYTLSAVAVEHADLPGRVRRNAPNPVPAVLMGRLAVDEEAQGSGLGRFLVRDAILSTLAAADRIGVRILLVHALHERAAGFYEQLGFKPSPTDPLHLYLLLADARKSLGD
jgi:GNAT superfamily N-acetyltransferase